MLTHGLLEMLEKATMAGLLIWTEIHSEESEGQTYKSFRVCFDQYIIELHEYPWMYQTFFRKRKKVGGTAWAIIVRGGAETKAWSNRPQDFTNIVGWPEEVSDDLRIMVWFMTMRHLIEEQDVGAELRTRLARELFGPPAAV